MTKPKRDWAPPSAPEPSLDTNETADLLGCSARKVTQLLRDGSLIGFRVGRQWRTTPSAIRKFQGIES